MAKKMKVDECPAGPWMDAAAEALGWCWHDGRGTAGPSYWEMADGDIYIDDFEPSTDIAAALELESEMPCFQLIRRATNLWQCQSVFCGDWFDHPSSSCRCQFGDAETIPLAICRAFLRANGVTEIDFEKETDD